MDRTWTLSLSDPEAVRSDITGSKAANLALVDEAGLPVPPGFVVTTDTFRAIASQAESELASLSDSASTSEHALTEASASVRRAIMEASLPRGSRAAIREAWESLGKPSVSVRSSSTAEDLDDASFAGQYDSYLNVTTFNDILQKIRLVWASLHSPRAIGYRRRNGLSHLDASMAVLLQRQLEPDAAGVMFTRDPLSGQNRVVIAAAYGLGEGVVGGSADTDRYVLRPRAASLISSDISEKRIRIVLAPSGGVEAVPVTQRSRKKAALNSRALTSLWEAGRHLARTFGSPQDVEYAIVGGKLRILQSRPMTAVAREIKPDVPWNKGVDRKHTWNRRGGPMRRLEEEVARCHLKYLKLCYDETGSSMGLNHVGLFKNGYMYVRPNPVGERTLKKRHKLQTQRVDRSLRKGKTYFEDVLQGVIVKRLDRLKKRKAKATTLAQKVNYLETCLDHEGYVQGNLHWRQGKPGGRKSWHDAFHEITDEPRHHADVFVQAIENRMTMCIARIRELARIAKSDPVLREVFITREFDDLNKADVKRRAKTRRFRQRFRAMLKVYGIRAGHGYGTSSNLQTPTWNMDHRIPFEFIATYVEQDLNELDRRERRAHREREQAIAQMRKKLSGDKEKLTAFNEALEDAHRSVRFLEDHNYYMEQCSIGVFREAIDLVGRALVTRDQIDDPDDVFHFSISDLKRIAQRKPSDLRPTVRERSDERERRRRMNAPPTLGKRPPKPKKQGDEPVAGLDGNVIRGQSASSGQATGKAVVIRSDNPNPKVHPGDILVASNVGPDWTAVFATMGGLVLDGGSLSQHAALMAREYGVPSVMQTKEASKIIQNSQRITVDGDAGVVELLHAEH